VSHEQMYPCELGTNMTMSTYLKSGLHPLNLHCMNWNAVIRMVGWLTGKMTPQYEPTAKPNAQVLTLEEKQHYKKVLLFQ
jgi:hypothetical protein